MWSSSAVLLTMSMTGVVTLHRPLSLVLSRSSDLVFAAPCTKTTTEWTPQDSWSSQTASGWKLDSRSFGDMLTAVASLVVPAILQRSLTCETIVLLGACSQYQGYAAAKYTFISSQQSVWNPEMAEISREHVTRLYLFCFCCRFQSIKANHQSIIILGCSQATLM